jgi:hypothetical protein
MQGEEGKVNSYEELEKALSLERFARYLDWAGDDRERAIELYSLNTALTFSFWTSMFGKDYETLWQQTLHKVGRRSDGKGLRRKDFSGPLAQIRSLRNRIAHHEPIVMWDLRKRYVSILELTGWLSPPALAWCQAHSRFEQVHPVEPIVLEAGIDAKAE